MKTKRQRTLILALNAAALEFCRWPPACVMISVFLAATIRNFTQSHLLALAYLPTIFFIFFTCMVINLQWSEFVKRNCYRIIDGVCATVIFGATYVTIFTEIHGIDLATSPLEIAMIVALPICFRPVKSMYLRNGIFVFTVLMILILSEKLFPGFKIKSSLLYQIFIGVGGGSFFAKMIAQKFVADAMLKEFLSSERNYFFQELENKYFPHQIKMIAEGKHINQTMPVGTRKAFCIKFDVVGSTSIARADKEKVFEHIFEMIDHLLTDNHKVTSDAPVAIKGRGFLAATAGDAVFISLDHPFDYGYHQHPELILSLISDVIDCFEKCFVSYLGMKCRLSIALVHEPVVALFSTLRQEYRLQGVGLNMAERYETLRKIIPDIKKTVAQGQHCLIIQNKVMNFLKEDPSYQRIDMKHSGFGPNVRDDPAGTFFFIRGIENQTRSLTARKAA